MNKKMFESKFPFMIIVMVIISTLVATIFITNRLSDEIVVESPTIIEHYEETYPVMNENNYLTNPYIDPSVTIGKNYYDYQGEEDRQESAITVQNNTYYQNTGIDYVKAETFDVIAIAEGTVCMVKEDELVGKTVEIEHKNGLISVYQSLGEITVQKGDLVGQGQIIGKSGTNEMDKELGNHLHFEIIENSEARDPILYLNKEYKKGN